MDASLALHDEGERTAGMLPPNNHSNGYEAFRLVKGGEGVLCGFSVYNSGAAQFIQMFDAAALPAEGAIPEMFWAVAATANLPGVLWIPGRTFRRGILLCNSSTGPTKTIGAADCFFDAQYI